MNGLDVKGPTAVLNSVCKLDPFATRSYVLNQRLMPQIVASEEGRKKVGTLIQSFFDREGYQIQFNIMDTATLRDAQQHPERYKDLVVRLGGYSSYFVDLAPVVQEEIINRTEQVI